MTRIAIVSVAALALLVAAGSAGVAQTNAAQGDGRTIWSGVYTESQARRGEELYGRSCARCHGADLTGIPLTPRFAGARARVPELVWPTLFVNYEDLPLCDLVERIRISMPQDRPGSHTRQEIVDVVAYLLFHGGFPVGRAELTTRFDDLQGTRIRAYRPSDSAPMIDRSCHRPAWK